MGRNELKRYILSEKIADLLTDDGKPKVYKNDTDDDIRAKIREALGGTASEEETPAKAPKSGKKGKAAAPVDDPECPAGGTYGKDADQHEECLECKHYKACATESEK